jgi:formylglycine-generating enzyme required for sulfatase activity
MVFIPGGTFNIGSDVHYSSERSAEDITVNSFCMDKYEITNAKFAQFVKETG